MPHRIPKSRAARLKHYGITRGFYDSLMGLPGYDPFLDAGDCLLDQEGACAAISFFHEELHHVKGVPGKPPFILSPWQRSIVSNIWGWKRPDGTRRFGTAFIYVPKKNGKTTFAAGLALLLMHTDGEPGAEIYSLAYTKDQASLIFQHATGMVRAADSLDYMRIFGASGGGQIRSIHDPDTLSFYRPLVADPNVADGVNVHAAFLDEVHRYSGRQAGVVTVIEGGTASRRQAIVFFTTTADFDHPSICNEKLDYAQKVRDGIIRDASFLPAIWETPMTADWHSPKVWKKANPNWGVTVQPHKIAELHRKAVETPSYEPDFKRLHLNMKTQFLTKWLSMEKWDMCPSADADPIAWRAEALERLAGRDCYAGIDLASKISLTALVLLFPESVANLREMPDGETPDIADCGYIAIPWFWMPHDTAEIDFQKHSIPYPTWSDQGFVTLTEGNVVDYRTIRKQVNDLGKYFNILEIGCDPWAATSLMVELGPDGDGFDVVEVPQTFGGLSEAAKLFQALIQSGRLEHGNNPVLRWMASAVEIRTDYNQNIRPVKPTANSPHKIDGISAGLTGLARASQGGGRNPYEERGILTL